MYIKDIIHTYIHTFHSRWWYCAKIGSIRVFTGGRSQISPVQFVRRWLVEAMESRSAKHPNIGLDR